MIKEIFKKIKTISNAYKKYFLVNKVTMKKIIIPPEQIVSASYFESWSFSIFGNPKAKIICGKCKRTFYTRDYIPFDKNKKDEGIVANCPGCGIYNKIKINIIIE